MEKRAATYQPPTFENGQDIRDRALEFACNVVAFCEMLEEGKRVGRLMVPQLLNCSLSFATMLEEARAAESDADFISKCAIGLKECREFVGAPARMQEMQYRTIRSGSSARSGKRRVDCHRYHDYQEQTK
jgi:four helix bundle protein